MTVALALLDDVEVSALLLSLQVGAVATLAGIVPAAVLAYWLARTTSRLRIAVEAVVVLPMVLPPVVVGYFLLVVLGRNGPVGSVLDSMFGVALPFTWVGAAIAALAMGFPLLVRGMRQAFESVDPGLEEAAQSLGAGRFAVFLTVSLPIAARGCVAGAALCFARTLGEFGATITFAGNIAGETRTLSLAIWTALQNPRTEASAWQMTWICVALSLAATVTSELLVRRRALGRRR